MTKDALHPHAIFFDMDGTILDWQTGMEESWRAACEAHCDGSFEQDVVYQAVRARRTWFWEDPERSMTGRMDLDAASREIVVHAFADVGVQSADLAHRIAADYRARRVADIVPYQGALETLETFRQRGVRMALITNGNAISQRRSVERYRLEQYFDCIVIEGEFGIGKPDERVFAHAMRSCGSAPESTWMVGDSLEADIAPAVALGMHAVWVDALGSGLPEAAAVRPHRVIRAITELP